MFKTHTPSFFLAFFLVSTLTFTSAFARNYPITIEDAAGRTITIEKPVQRIAFSGTCIGESLVIAGVWDKVVGRGFMMAPDRILYPGIDNIPVFATESPGPYNVNYEKLLDLDIDVLFTIKSDYPGFDEMNNKIKSRIKVVALEMFLPGTMKSNFKILSAIFDKEQCTKEYIDWYEHIVQTITTKTDSLPPEKRKRFFLNWSYGEVTDFTTMSDKFQGMVATNDILGGINVAANLHSMWGGVVDPEWLMQQDIDVIVCQGKIPKVYGTDVDSSAKLLSFRKQIIGLSVFASSKAVKQGKVYMISPQFMFSPGLPIYLAYLAKWFHPELFPNLTPLALHQEYLARFLHTNFDLSKHGVFVCPK